MDYRHIQVTPCTPVIGAEISGVDLSQPLSDGVFGEIEQALLDHLVVFFRDQDLPPEAHLAFARRFGETAPPHPVIPSLAGHPPITVFENDENTPAETNTWHTDITFAARPAMGSILYCVDCPEPGGDTIWANLYAAYEALSDPIKTLIRDLRAVHSIENFGATRIYDSREADVMGDVLTKNPPVEHPVVRTHPVTGKTALFVNRTFTRRIRGLRKAEAEAILELLCRQIEVPEHQVRFHWAKGSVAIWDNRCTQHYALNDYFPAYRKMHRVMVEGDVPFYRPEGLSRAAE